MKETLNSEFDSFRSACIPGDAPKYQIDDMKAAFFGGSICALRLMARAIIATDTPEEGLTKLGELFAECREFDLQMRAEGDAQRMRRH
jgi:hypothetical protein